MSKTLQKKEPAKKHTCSQCGSAFSRPYRLKQHEKMHQNIKQFVCGEPNCNKSYTSKSHLDRHIYSVHIEPAVNMIYSCPECMKVFVNRQNLKRHIKVYHGKKTGFTCDVCSSNFKKKHQLSAHMYKHTFVKSFSCDLCNNEFITLFEKKKHMKQHKTYSCDLCDMAFVQWSKYLKHKKMMHLEYQCDNCSRKFTKRSHMVRHSKLHNTRNTPTFYPCTYENCDRVYSRNSNLKQHIKMKHLKVKHECEICFAKLSTKATLHIHLERHRKPKEHIPPRTKETGRKERRDKGVIKTSTALRIAGLLVDPEDESIRGTSKSITDSSNELEVINNTATEENIIQDIITDNPKELNNIPGSAVMNSDTCDAMEVSIFEIKETLDTSRTYEEPEKPAFKDHPIQQLCEFNVS